MGIFDNFRFEPNGKIALSDAIYHYLKEEIAFGRIDGGMKFPTMREMARVTGLSFGQARYVVERLAREGYVFCKTQHGTVVRSRGRNSLVGRVLVAYPDIDICRYYPTQLFDTINRKLTAAGFAVSVSSFPIDENCSLAHFESELLRATDLIIAMRATPSVQKCLAKSGIQHIFAYGDKPVVDDDSPWIPFLQDEAMVKFAEHCKKAGVHHVTQVRFEDDEMLDATSALAEKGIDSSWLTMTPSGSDKGRFAGIVKCAYKKFKGMPLKSFPDLLLFWNAFAAQGALMAFLERGIRIPEKLKVVSITESGFGPVYVKPMTRFESDPIEAGEKISDFAISILTKGRIPSIPKILPKYVFGNTFPFKRAKSHHKTAPEAVSGERPENVANVELLPVPIPSSNDPNE